MQPLLDAREIFEDALEIPARADAGLALQAAELEILRDAHAGEQPAALRHVADAEPRDLRGAQARDLRAAELDRAGGGRGDADQRFEQRRLAGAVAAEQRDDLVRFQVEGDIVEDVALAVEGVDVVDLKQHVAAGRGFARLRGDMRRAGADIDVLHFLRGARILDRAVDQHLAVIHHRDMVGQAEHAVDVVLDQQHRQFARQMLDQRADALALGGGEAGERLVEQQNARLDREREPHVEQALAAIG